MNFATLSSVVFGDKEAMKDFLFENSLQHTLFRDTLIEQGKEPPGYPITDVDFDNFDDWLLYHQNEHQYFAATLDLNNPFNMLDADFKKEDDFYDWITQHYLIHMQIAEALTNVPGAAAPAATAIPIGPPFVINYIDWINNSLVVIPWNNNSSVTIPWTN